MDSLWESIYRNDVYSARKSVMKVPQHEPIRYKGLVLLRSTIQCRHCHLKICTRTNLTKFKYRKKSS